MTAFGGGARLAPGSKPGRRGGGGTTWRTRLAVASAIGLIATTAAPGIQPRGVNAQGPTTAVFNYTGGTQSYTVPADVCAVSVDAWGAEGGQGLNPDGPRSHGGLGGRATATVFVTPGEVLLVRVGGRGIDDDGGFNGGGNGGDGTQDDGGGGGGASDVRRAPFDFPDRLVVAGGGGGGGGDADGNLPTSHHGGAGGGLVGGDGLPSEPPQSTPGGKGGTQTAGGAAPRTFDITAENGSFGQGGTGGVGPSVDDAGGGGGGGWYGGGGGAGEDDDVPTDDGGGGGGGSGFGPDGTQFETGVRSGDGLVEITPLPGACNVAFDWTMPERFGFDKNNDGLTDYYPPSGNLVIEPSGWRVELKQVQPATCDQSHRRKWFIDGHEVLANDSRVIFFHPTSCTFIYEFPTEAVYDVQLEVRDSGGNFVGIDRRDVTVQDWLIVSIGDSIASGEGNPDIDANPTLGAARWQSERCHRSAFAGPALAARAIEENDPRTSVTFVHLACSGADIKKGLLQDYNGIVSGTGEPRPPAQVSQIRALAPTRQIDAILMSIGANDVEFSTIVERCVLHTACHLGSAANLFNNRVAGLPARFSDLASRLASAVPGHPSRRIYVTEYADPTRYDDASICGSPLLDGSGGRSKTVLYDHPISLLGKVIDEFEAAWASNVMLVGLNQTVQQATLTHGWSWIGNIRVLFLTHGYCAANPAIETWTESKASQGDENGALHPNSLGQNGYGNLILDRLTVEFYASGNLKNPRRPGT